MNRLYLVCLALLSIFLSSPCYADDLIAKPLKKLKVPGFLISPTNSSSFPNNGFFYNQEMEKLSLDHFDNRLIILHFWATWCLDGKAELLELESLQKDFRKKPLLVIAISEDFKKITQIDEFYRKNKIEYLDLYLDKRNKLQQLLGIKTLPASYIIDFDGKIILQSMPGIKVNWSDKEFRDLLDSKMVNYHLLPPEYKKPRPKFESAEKTEPENKQNKKISKIFVH